MNGLQHTSRVANMNPLVADLSFALVSNKAVEVHVYAGSLPELCGVRSIDEEENGTVSFWTPKTFGDKTTFARVETANIASVTVTDVDW